MRTVVVVVLYRGCVFIRSHVCQSVRTNGERERARRGQSRSLCPRLLFRGHATTRSGTREREKERKREREKEIARPSFHRAHFFKRLPCGRTRRPSRFCTKTRRRRRRRRRRDDNNNNNTKRPSRSLGRTSSSSVSSSFSSSS